VEVPDPSASTSWLADVFGLDVLRIGQDAAQVPLPGCAITFASGPADRITAVVLNGLGAPSGIGSRAALPRHGLNDFSFARVRPRAIVQIARLCLVAGVGGLAGSVSLGPVIWPVWGDMAVACGP
jgi:hypothetical protein